MVIVFWQMAYNSLTVEGALTLINVVKNTPKSAIEEINICVSSEALLGGGRDTFIIKHYAIAIPEYYDFKLCIDSDFHIFCSLEN